MIDFMKTNHCPIVVLNVAENTENTGPGRIEITHH